MMKIKHLRFVVSCLFLGFITILSLGTTGCSSKPTTAATLSSITIAPASPSNLPVGIPQVFVASGTYSDGRSGDNITNKVVWTSSDPTIATVSASGTAMGVAIGSTKITASLNGITSQTVTLTVITATPAPPTTTSTTTP
jgi:uncharacterized protein YjdB